MGSLRARRAEFILLGMATAEAMDHLLEPVVIYRSVNRDGQTFALDPLSRNRVRDHFGDEIHLHPRVFIAHETAADYGSMRADLADQVVQLLTSVSSSRLDELGGASFRDSTDEGIVPTREA